MLRVETGLHVQIKVEPGTTGINDLAAWAFGARSRLVEGVLAGVLWQLQEGHLATVLRGEAELVCPGCGTIRDGPGAVLRRGSRPRQVRTSSGRIRFRLRQVTCPDCRKTWSPYPGLLGLAPRQRVTEELERRLVDMVTELSYAKTSRLAAEWLGVTLSPRHLHRTVQRQGARVAFGPVEPVETIVADGTKVPAGRKQRGEDIVIALQLQGRTERQGRTVVGKRVVGFGIGPGSWPAALTTAGEPELVVTDGESGIAQAVTEHCPDARHQRCVWHLPYSLRHMLGREGIPAARQRQVAREVTTLLEQPASEGRGRYEDLAAGLTHQPRSRNLLETAADFVFFDDPSAERTTGVVEREMRESNRRMDVGARWSVPGAAHLEKLRLARRHNPDEYQRLWRPIRGLQASVVAHA